MTRDANTQIDAREERGERRGIRTNEKRIRGVGGGKRATAALG